MSFCSLCNTEVEVGDWPAEWCKGDPNGHQMKHHRFVPVEVDLGKLGKHTVSSHADFARLEKMHLNRTGQEISFREFNQNPSNRDSNSMGPGPQVNWGPREMKNRRGMPFEVKRSEYKGK